MILYMIKTIKIPCSSIYWHETYILFNGKIKVFLEKDGNYIYQIVSLMGYPTAQSVDFNFKEMTIKYL